MENTENKRKAFLIYFDFMDMVSDLTDEEAGQLFKSMGQYAITQEIPDFKHSERLVKVVFKSFKSYEDENRAKWEKAQTQRSEAGKASAEARKRKKEESTVGIREKHRLINEAYKREMEGN